MATPIRKTAVGEAYTKTAAAQDHFTAFLKHILELTVPDGDRKALAPHIRETAYRVTTMFQRELLDGYSRKPEHILATAFKEEEYDAIVIVRAIPFVSLCAHHLLPFRGTADVAYLPNGRVVGLSKLARLVEAYARRLQIQERMTYDVARALMKHLKPRGAACIIRAEHLCMSARGIQKSGTETVTSAILGVFRKEPETRAELMALLGAKP